MMIITLNAILAVLFALPILFWIFYKNYTRNYNYWKVRGVPYEEPVFPYGSVKEYITQKKYMGYVHKELYEKFSEEKYFGMHELNRTTFVVKDPELIKMILVKDFQYFMDKLPLAPKPKDPSTIGRLNGQEWKDKRQRLTPTFTSGKMKMMFVHMEKCTVPLKEFIDKNQNKPLDARKMLIRFTMDMIASCAFGLEINSSLFNSLINKKYLRPSMNAQFVAICTPKWLKKMITYLYTPFNTNVLRKVIKEAIDYRKKNNIIRHDFLDVLINQIHIKNSGDHNRNDFSEEQVSPNRPKIKFTQEQIIANAVNFFMAGCDGASSLMTFALYELSRHQDIQTTLYHNIKQAVDNNGGHITDELLTKIPYLEQIINETLRYYGAGPILSRTCSESYRVPGSQLELEKGTRVIIPIYCLHHDPRYFPDPDEFRPERFSPENSKARHPYVFLPFGAGPRTCMASRFARLQAKLGLATVILNCKVSLSPDQPVPLQLSTKSVFTLPEAPVWLILNKRDAES